MLRSDLTARPRAPQRPGQADRGGRLVEMPTRAGELVVDPFLRPGTTGLACLATRRQSLGADVDRRAASTAGERLGVDNGVLTYIDKPGHAIGCLGFHAQPKMSGAAVLTICAAAGIDPKSGTSWEVKISDTEFAGVVTAPVVEAPATPPAPPAAPAAAPAKRAAKKVAATA